VGDPGVVAPRDHEAVIGDVVLEVLVGRVLVIRS